MGVCTTRCRLDRRVDAGGGSAASSVGLGSARIFRFRLEGGAGVWEASGGATAAAGVELEEAALLAACRVDERVTLGDMSKYVTLCHLARSRGRHRGDEKGKEGRWAAIKWLAGKRISSAVPLL